MTKYLEPSFSTLPPAGQSYRDNHDRIFGKKPAEAEITPEPESPAVCDPPSLSEVDAYLALILRDAEFMADMSYGEGPGRMLDAARWGEAVALIRVLGNVREYVQTGVIKPLRAL